ncbi:F0F1 ATP synthase subunit epsilon [Haloimpatiens sp. FM7330]|uniref:F0F1 ATP synthase subunit epsilon n=1 Tax=Haloimpatiens sp. FM7330 TaxID=3298610 RepID=UPI003643F09E
MEDILNITIITPEKEFYSGEIVELNTECVEGHIGILPNHVPMITVLKPTITVIKDKNGKKLRAFTSNGMMEVDSDNNVKIACDACEWPDEIDVNRAQEAKKRAEERLNKKDKDLDVKRAKMALLRAMRRLKIKEINS